jgi:hypothetical protein
MYEEEDPIMDNPTMDNPTMAMLLSHEVGAMVNVVRNGKEVRGILSLSYVHNLFPGYRMNAIYTLANSLLSFTSNQVESITFYPTKMVIVLK